MSDSERKAEAQRAREIAKTCRGAKSDESAQVCARALTFYADALDESNETVERMIAAMNAVPRNASIKRGDVARAAIRARGKLRCADETTQGGTDSAASAAEEIT